MSVSSQTSHNRFSFSLQPYGWNVKAPTQGHLHQIMRAAHVIKGAASNLMCQQLRTSAMNLEQAAAAANDLSGDASAMANVQGRYMELSQAVESYKKFLISVGV